MRKIINSLEKKTADFIKRNIKYLLAGYLIGILTYFMLMSFNLVNDLDGTWHLSNFIAGDWEISLGRGLQRYADRFRFGIVAAPFNSMLTLLLIEAANVMILEKLDLKKGIYPWLILTVLTANPVICNSLTYVYMSVNFGLAYLFSVLAFYFLDIRGSNKNALIKGALCGILLAISMSFYQAYICVTSVLVLVFIIKMLDEEKESIKDILRYFMTYTYVVIVAGGVYWLITKGLLLRAGIQLAAYKGADHINLSRILLQFPASLKKCYTEFWRFLYEAKAFSNLEFINIILTALLLCCLLISAIHFIKLFKRSKKRALLYAVAISLIPAAGCMVLMIAVGNSMSGLMSMGLVMSITLFGMSTFQGEKSGFWMKRAGTFLLVMFAWYQLSAVINDQLALQEGKTATITLTENIISQLYREGYLEEYQTVAFIGRPADNDRYAQSTAYQMANGYARFGYWSVDARNNRVSWQGVISNFIGVNLALCGDNEYESLVSRKQVADMPEFPLSGSICVMDDIVVVKVSDVY